MTPDLNYGDSALKVEGKVLLDIDFDGKRVQHGFYVTKKTDHCLCGRDLMFKLGISLNGLNEKFRVAMVGRPVDFGALLDCYEVDDNQLIKGFEARVYFKKGAVPKYHKPRQTLLAIRPLVEEALNGLVSKGILEPVPHSEWSSCIVPVMKKSGKIRVCADFKYLNTQINIEKYPLLRLEEMLSIVGNSKIFSRLYIENAYLQIPVKDDALVISTQCGLFRFLRLPYVY